MKFFFVFLLLINTCSAQKIIVRDESGNALANVSILLLEKENSLIGITDNEGVLDVALTQKASYLFHLLGFEDLQLSYSAILAKPDIVLNSSVNQLADVVVAYSKSNSYKIKNIPSSSFWAHANFSKSSVNKIIQIKIDSAGFLNKLSFPVKSQDSENVSDYRFVLFKDDNGKPTDALINESIVGKIDSKKLQFELKSLNFYLEKGSYFFGFEAITPAGFTKKEREVLVKRKPVLVPLLIKNSSDSGKTYVRENFGEWKTEIESGFEKGKKVTFPSKFLAYELEILTAVAK
ncbi:MAG: hypothetical protein EOO91_03205 [Pedobacter sp.]|nr:MAG: hypothetical protein EOO91_03205 [Pedobacter sp.]